MSIRHLFSEEEWMTVTEAMSLAGVGVSCLDMGLVSFVHETTSIVKTISSASERYPDNALIVALTGPMPEEEAAEEGTGPIRTDKTTTLDEIFAFISKAVALVEAKTPNEAAEYKKLLLEVADGTANAAGGFLGFGEKVSEAEAKYLERLRTELRL